MEKGKTILTSAQIRYIRKNRMIESGCSMARKLGVEKSVVGRFMKNNDLTPPKEITEIFRVEAMTGRTSSTPEMDQILRDNYLNIPEKRLAKMLCKSGMFVRKRLSQLGLIIPREIIDQRIQDSRLKPGNIPFQKGMKQHEYMSAEAIERTKATRFQKGQVPHNARRFKDGDITIRRDKLKDGKTVKEYQWIRISKAKWMMLHVHNWVQKNGPVPEGYIVVFRNRDTMNCDPSNLELITLEQNMLRNSIHRFPVELLSTIRLVHKLNKKIKLKDGKKQ